MMWYFFWNLMNQLVTATLMLVHTASLLDMNKSWYTIGAG
uniref:Uncharacterized protein n=1 Tax=Arundo donax TaxID=35708 RepID=A0A0A9B5H8_ARUDO